MGLTEKIIGALMAPLKAAYIRLDNDDGVSGFVVSSKFEGMSSLDRQRLIDQALRSSADPLTKKEHRQVVMIACLTPMEYESVGARIRISNIKSLRDGSIEVLLHGGHSDALYVKDALSNRGDITTSVPKQSQDENGILMTFRARGTVSNPLSKAEAIRILKADRYIELSQSI